VGQNLDKEEKFGLTANIFESGLNSGNLTENSWMESALLLCSVSVSIFLLLVF